MSLLLSLAALTAILAAVSCGGVLVAAALFPPGSTFRPERWGWGFPLGAALVAAASGIGLALKMRSGWTLTLGVFALAAAIALRLRVRQIGADAAPAAGQVALRAVLIALVAAGVLLYLLRAVTEPMWSNDFLAIWGLKGKTIFSARRLPADIWPRGFYGFSHPEYPLGLPFLYAGIAALLGRWDDHAMALLFPFFQAATLSALFGWLKRRGQPWPLPLAAAALLSLFEPLYSGFLVGMAEVPLSATLLLFGTAHSDCLDGTDLGAGRRLLTASLLAAGTKNEGVFLAVAGAIGAVMTRSPARWRVAAAALLPAVAVAAWTRALSAGARLRDFDAAFLGPRIAELSARLAEALRVAFVEVALPAWPILACLAILLMCGRSVRSANRLLALSAAALAAYMILPAFAVLGPTWLVRTTLARTAAALAPLVAAGLAGRLGSVAAMDPPQPEQVPESRQRVTENGNFRLG